MNYLLLGGAGFIGTHLSKRLIEDGHNVTIIDSLVTASSPDYGVKFIKGDVGNMDLDPYLSETDIVYYLAGSVGVEYIDKNPSSTLFNNIALMTALIPQFEKHQVKVIFSSTSEVYGEGPFNEDNNLSIGAPTKLRWGYACAKLMTEFMLRASTFPSVIVRFFNVVGPGQSGDYGMVLPRFVSAAKAGQNLIVYGDGKQIRSFCHIKDAVDGIIIASNTNGELFNIGNDTPTSMNELASAVLKEVHTTAMAEHVPYERDFSKEHGDIYYRVPDINKIKKLGYEPKYDLSDIIKDML